MARWAYTQLYAVAALHVLCREITCVECGAVTHCFNMLWLHPLQVRAMCWASNDSRVVSAGADGAVYEWRLSDLRREKENVLKGCQYK